MDLASAMRSSRFRTPRYQMGVLAALGSGAGLAVLGASLALPDVRALSGWSVAVTAVGLLLLAASIGLAHPLGTLPILTRKTTGGVAYDRRKHWTRLKVLSVDLNLLALLAGTILVGALLHRVGVISPNLSGTAVARLASLLILGFALNLASSFFLSLRTPIERRVTSRGLALVAFWLFLSLLFTLLAGAVAVGLVDSFLGVHLQPPDASFVLLGGLLAACLALFRSRRLPGIYALALEDRTLGEGRTYLSGRKSVIMPISIAFVLLFIVLFVFLLLEFGLTGLREELPHNAALIGAVGAIGIALVVAISISLITSRSQDQTLPYRERRSHEANVALALKITSAAVGFALLAAALLLFLDVPILGRRLPSKLWIDAFCFALLGGLGPYGFYVAHRRKLVRQMEERFPDFLRDLGASRRAGLTLENAVRVAAKGEYGALTPEIQKMADQLSWNIPFDEVLRRFGERVRTPLIERAVSLVVESGKTGGQVTDVLLAAATDAREIKGLELERRNAMTLYTIVIYVTFLVFLLIVAILYATFVPQIVNATAATQDLGSTGALSFGTLPLESFRIFYFLAAVMQGLGNGFVAGLLESGRPSMGLRHAFVMVAVSYATFSFAL